MKHQTVYGYHAVLSALERRPEAVTGVWLLDARDDERMQAIKQLCNRSGIAIQTASRATLDKMTDEGRHQGMVAQVRPAPVMGEAELKDLLSGVGQHTLILVLDGVQDPHNLGACIRTAEAAGVTAVVFPRDKSADLTAVARKAAAGAADRVPVYRVGNLARALETIKQAGVWVVGTAGDATQTIYALDLTGPLAMVMGGEGKGMHHRIRELCDHTAHIPMGEGAESLNVSVAAGVCLFEAKRQRQS